MSEYTRSFRDPDLITEIQAVEALAFNPPYAEKNGKTRKHLQTKMRDLVNSGKIKAFKGGSNKLYSKANINEYLLSQEISLKPALKKEVA